jgi:hypothetical protein
VEHVQLAAPEFMDYGPPNLVGMSDSDDATSVGHGRTMTGPRNFRRLALPRRPGTQQQISLMHSVARTTDWDVAFTADYYLPSLIARKTT